MQEASGPTPLGTLLWPFWVWTGPPLEAEAFAGSGPLLSRHGPQSPWQVGEQSRDGAGELLALTSPRAGAWPPRAESVELRILASHLCRRDGPSPELMASGELPPVAGCDRACAPSRRRLGTPWGQCKARGLLPPRVFKAPKASAFRPSTLKGPGQRSTQSAHRSPELTLPARPLSRGLPPESGLFQPFPWGGLRRSPQPPHLRPTHSQ